jgi:hypothetical protein
MALPYNPLSNPGGLVPNYGQQNTTYPSADPNGYIYPGTDTYQSPLVQTPSPTYGTNSGRASGDSNNVAQNSMESQGIATGGNLLSDAVGDYFKQQENEKNRNEARSLADINRNDKQKQLNYTYSLNKRTQEQEQQKMKLDQTKQQIDLRYNRWIALMQKAQDSRKKIQDVAKNLFDPTNSVNIQDLLINQFGGKNGPSNV